MRKIDKRSASLSHFLNRKRVKGAPPSGSQFRKGPPEGKMSKNTRAQGRRNKHSSEKRAKVSSSRPPPRRAKCQQKHSSEKGQKSTTKVQLPPPEGKMSTERKQRAKRAKCHTRAQECRANQQLPSTAADRRRAKCQHSSARMSTLERISNSKCPPPPPPPEGKMSHSSARKANQQLPSTAGGRKTTKNS